MNKNQTNAILLVSCPDQRGLTARITDFIYKNNGNVEHLDQHVDLDRQIFFMRVEWTLDGFDIAREEIPEQFAPLARQFNMEWKLHFTDARPNMAIFVSKNLHCLYDLLFRYKEGQLHANIPLIISNHPDAGEAARTFGIDFHDIPVNKDSKVEQEKKQLKILKDNNIEIVVLARYMQILTKQFVDAFPFNIINIHHSFLPAFVGANPYEQAYRRGVKIIGATSHFVTEKLDAGPIIEQDVVRVSHRDLVRDLQRKGQDLEKVVLSRAVCWHLERKILVYGTNGAAKTVVFD